MNKWSQAKLLKESVLWNRDTSIEYNTPFVMLSGAIMRL